MFGVEDCQRMNPELPKPAWSGGCPHTLCVSASGNQEWRTLRKQLYSCGIGHERFAFAVDELEKQLA